MDPTTLSALIALIPAQYAVYVAAVGGICAFVASRLPAPSATSAAWYPAVYAVVNFVGCNFGHAKNASPSEKVPPSPRQ